MAGRKPWRAAAALLALALIVTVVGPNTAVEGPSVGAQQPSRSPASPTGTGTAAGGASTVAAQNPVPDGGRARHRAGGVFVPPPQLPAGSLVFNPVSGRDEVIDPRIAERAVLIGDSQSGGAAGVKGSDTWVAQGLTARGYSVRFLGAGGTGFAASTPWASNYSDAVHNGQVVLPHGNPALVVVQGGGNDAAQGIPDERILAGAARLLGQLKASYPDAEFLFIGTLATGSHHDGGRRTQVDALLAGFAYRNGVRFISAGDWLTRYGVTAKMADHVHLTRGGHQVLATVLASKLQDMGLQGPGAH